MKNSPTYRIAATCLIVAISACKHTALQTTNLSLDTERTTFSDPADFVGVSFKTGKPIQSHDTLRDTLTSSLDEEALEKDLELLKRTPPDIPLRIVGFTDSKECLNQACLELSLRRAQYVNDWLVNRGIPKSRLSEPQGFGATRPIDDNETEQGRARNRRAYISYD